MWKILLVEDEPFVRRSIRQAIRWEEHGFTIAGEASHGQEALEMMAEHQPDIVVSDIFMPYMDGLELLQAARAKGFEGSFIMLTCAGEFEYARLALEHGASGYILKLSMSDEELLQALNKAKAGLVKQAEQQDRLQWQSFHEYADCLWREMYGKELYPYEAGKLEGFRRLLEASPGLLLVSVLNGSRPLQVEELQHLLPPGAGEAVRSCRFNHMGQTTFFVWPGEAARGATAQLRGPIRETAYEGLPVICRSITSASGLTAGWLLNLSMLDRHYYGCVQPARFPEAVPGLTPESLSVPWEQEHEVISCFERLEVKECSGKLEQLWAFMQTANMPMASVKETAERLDKLFARISGKNAEPPGPLLDAERHSGLLEQMDRRMRAYAKGLSRVRLPETDHPEINAMIRYLLQHYDQDISLQAMAHYVKMDENYLSGLFKKKTGQTFINYLQHIRVNEAKFYLEQTGLTVAEIGERVGFANPSYFFKIFKRWTGLTPNEHRLQRKGQEANS
ncbi:response regulator [Paenibacillus sp. FSL L8-0470]|uniref:response regulator n=1 Tax=Paenibacillus sp. FSL L8-0470 TaxID=2954688 RepID=UPI0030F5F84F